VVLLDTHSKKIIEVLLESQSPLSSSEIAHEINITPRMVIYRINRLKPWIAQKELHITTKTNKGIQIIAPTSKRRMALREIKEMASDDLSMTKDDRREYIKIFLLICNEPIVSKQLKKALNVSKVTVLKDIDDIENWFSRRGLTVCRKPGYGIILNGNLFDKRLLLIELIMEKLGVFALAKLSRGSSVQQAAKAINNLHPQLRDLITRYLSDLDFSYAWEITSRVEDGLEIQLEDNSFISTMLFFAILIDHLRKKIVIKEINKDIELKNITGEYYLSQAIGDKIEHRYGVYVTEIERICIANFISGLEIKKTISEAIGEWKKKKINPEVDILTKNILVDVSLFLHPYLLVDTILYWEIALYIQAIFNSLRFPHPFREEVTSQIRVQRPYIYSIAQEAVQKIEKAIGFELPESIIGKFSILLISALERICSPNRVMRNVILVNDFGYETSSLLSSRIKSQIPEIDIIECIGTLELLERKIFRDGVDAIITTADIGKISMPSIQVSPLLTKEEVSKIRDTLNIGFNLTQGSIDAYPSLHLCELLSDKSIALNVAVKDWKQSVEKAGILLLRKGAIHPRYIDAMKDLIIENGPYVVSSPGTALLHARPDQGAKRTGMSFISLKHGVNFGHSDNDPVDLVFALSAVDSFSIQIALKEFVNLINNRRILNRIRTTTSIEGVIDCLKELYE